MWGIVLSYFVSIDPKINLDRKGNQHFWVTRIPWKEKKR